MPDYEKPYYILFNSATDAQRCMEAQNYGQAREGLIAAQQRAEECFLLGGETDECSTAAARTPSADA